jgi:ADP-ribose pyrophosphatase
LIEKFLAIRRNSVIDETRRPVLVGERIISDAFARFGKVAVEYDYRMSDGNVLPFFSVRNPGEDPVIIFAVTDANTVFLVNQFRFATNEFVLELPGGCPKSGQTWQDATNAELLEEVGVEASGLRLIGPPILLNPAIESIQFKAVLATGCKVVKEQQLDDTEVMTVREVALEKFWSMLKGGEIKDGKTVATAFFAFDQLGLLR